MRGLRTVALVALLTFLGAAAFASSASATAQIGSFSMTPSTTQAGGHPDIKMSLALLNPGAPEAARNVVLNAPEGVFGNPNAQTRCVSADFALRSCPSNSQAGLATIRANYGGDSNHLMGTVPIFAMVPQAEESARFSFLVPILDIPVAIPVAVRTGGDFGLRFTAAGITQLTPLAGADLTYWGFPASESHDNERFAKGSPGFPPGCPELADASCITSPTPSSIPDRPLTDNPTICTGQPLKTTLDVDTYQDIGNFAHAESDYPPTTGCEKETFNPVLDASLTTNETDSASGLNLSLSSPQFLGFAATPSQIRSATVLMPEGLTINPDAADGQSACSDADANFGTEEAAQCPDNSKIGTFAIKTPALDGPLLGSLYIGEPKPGNQYRLFMTADGFGIHAKLKGSFEPDPQTGRLTTHFDELPQAPFETFELHLFASDRGLLATPTSCTLYEIDGLYVPWNESLAPQHSQALISFDSGPHRTLCPGQIRPFNPRLVAGTSNPVAGAYSDFTLKLDRDDGDQFLGDLNFKMPPGFTGNLRGIAYCPEAAIAAAAQSQGRAEQANPSCPANSQVGTSNVAAGPGSHPFHAVGKMYLAGPFKGAPLSLVAATPALAGPYDYGVVVVRVALHVDPLTAQVTAASDTVPAIIGGIPIRMRSIQVSIDKPRFTINPTNCDAMSVDSQGIGDQGTVADFSSYFNAVNCATLPFKPKMTIRQRGGRKATRRATNPALQFDLTTRAGDANIKSISVTLPSAFNIDQTHLGNICSEKELAATECAGRQAIGEATTTTPLLDRPLSGQVYAVSGSGGLPRLAFVLNGQVKLLPRADTVAVDGRLQTTVPVVPDAAIGHFRLVIFGGKHGYLINTRDICRHTPMVSLVFVGQNGKTLTQRVKTKVSCGGKSKRRAKGRNHRRTSG